MSFLLPPLPPTFEAALRDVRAERPEARIAAAERLATPDADGHVRAFDGLCELARDRDARVRACALRGLRELGDEAAMPQLLACLEDDDALVRELAALALSAFDGARAVQELRRALHSQHPEVRFQAVAGFAERCAPDELGTIAELLRDPDPKVRGHAARSLGRVPGTERDALRAALRDPSSSVRAEAALSLARAQDASGAPELRGALEDPELALEALEAIATLDLQDLREPVAALAQSFLKPLTLKVAAARALVRMRDARGVPALREVLRAFRSDGRSYAVQVVGELRVAELASELVRLCRFPRGADLEALVESLRALWPSAATVVRPGLERLARRRDRAGELARLALASPPPS